MTNPNYQQAAYRLYEDGTESGSTAIDNQDTAITRTVTGDSNLLLRIRLQITNAAGGAATDDFQLQRAILRPNGLGPSTGWVNVTASSNAIKGFASADLTDGGATTNRLTGGTGSFVAGKISEDGLVDDLLVTASNFTELLYALTVVQTDVGHGDVITFRLLRNGATLNSYAITPQITVSKISTGFGAIKGVLTAGAASITNPASPTGSVVVAADDLIYVFIAEQANLTAAAVDDNLTHSYTEVNSGGDDANATGKAYFVVVTNPGTLTQVDIDTTAGGDNYAAVAIVFEGPFDPSPLDANPANTLGDITTPFDFPATGTMTQADELVIGGMAVATYTAWTASNVITFAVTSPDVFVLSQGDASGSVTGLFVVSRVVASTSSVTLSLSSPSGNNPADSVLITASFKKQVAGAKQGEARFAGAGALSSLATQNQSFAATFNGSGALSVLVNQSLQSSATFAGAGSLSAETIKYKLGEATFVGAGSLSALAQTYKFAEATFAGSGQLSIYANMAMRIAATFDGHGNLSAAALQRMAASAFLNGAGDLSVQATHVSAGGEVHQGEATFAGAGNLAVFANLNAVISARFDGAGNLSVETQKSKAAEATFAGAGDLSIYARLNALIAATFNGAGLLSVNGDLAGRQEGAATFDGAGSLQVAARMAAAAAAVLGGAGDWSVQVTAGYAASVRFTGTGNLIVSAAAGNVAAAVLAGAGDLSAEAAMQMPVSAVFAGAGSLSADTAIIAFGTHMGEATFGGRGGMVVDLLQFGPRRTRSSKSEQSLGTRGGVNIVRSRNDRRITRRTGT